MTFAYFTVGAFDVAVNYGSVEGASSPSGEPLDGGSRTIFLRSATDSEHRTTAEVLFIRQIDQVPAVLGFVEGAGTDDLFLYLLVPGHWYEPWIEVLRGPARASLAFGYGGDDGKLFEVRLTTETDPMAYYHRDIPAERIPGLPPAMRHRLREADGRDGMEISVR